MFAQSSSSSSCRTTRSSSSSSSSSFSSRVTTRREGRACRNDVARNDGVQSRPRRHKKQFARRRRRTTPTTSVLDDDDDDDDAKKAEQVGVTLVVFANARENSCLKYPKSLPDYKSDDSTKKADDFVPWKDVWEHVGRRLRWSNARFETIVLDCADEDEMSSERAMEACSKATCFIACDVGENADVATHMSRLTAPIPTWWWSGRVRRSCA